MFVNPGCGSFRGESIYEKHVESVFNLCRISSEVVVTQCFGDGRQQLLTRDLSGVDGIVVIGGDGTFSNIAQGLLERTQRDAGLELRKKNYSEAADSSPADSSPADLSPKPFFNIATSTFVSNSIPITQIPGGTGNAYAATTSGVQDAHSTAILIALGKTMYTDVIGAEELSEDPASIMVRSAYVRRHALILLSVSTSFLYSLSDTVFLFLNL